MINSVLYSFYYSLPAEYGLRISLNDSSKFIVWYSLGEIVLISITGFLMAYAHPIALFVFTFFLALINRMLLMSFKSEAKMYQERLLTRRHVIELNER